MWKNEKPVRFLRLQQGFFCVGGISVLILLHVNAVFNTDILLDTLDFFRVD